MHSAPSPRRPRPLLPTAARAEAYRAAYMRPAPPVPVRPAISEQLLTLALRLLGILLLLLAGWLLWPSGQTHPLSLSDSSTAAPAAAPRHPDTEFYDE